MKAKYDREFQAYLALIAPIQVELAKLEEPYRKKIYTNKLARLADEARAAHQTPAEKRTPAQQELAARTARLLAVSPQETLNAMSDADKARHRKLQERLRTFDPHKPAPLPTAIGMQELSGTPPKTFVLEAGEPGNKTDEVHPGFPSVLAKHQAEPAESLGSAARGRRTALAWWITAGDNALAARVLVNRLWQHHFGRGIVRTPSDFGVRGEPPTHPELLDWLAVEFVESGFSVKYMHRLMLVSATYQQASSASADALASDPNNDLFSRWNRQRLEGEIIRDGLLAASGRLNRAMGGQGVFPPVPAEALQGTKAWPVSPRSEEHVRRSVYIFARRNLRFPFLEAFDLPDSNLSCPKRERSTTAPQALALLNAPEVVAAAKALAARLQREANNHDERINLACRLTLGREPTGMEMERARAFLHQSPLHELCRALFNLNEFVYID